MSDETTHKVPGYRTAAYILREVATLAERNPDLPKAMVTFGSYGSDFIQYFVQGTEPKNYWLLPEAERKALKLAAIEEQYALIMGHFDGIDGPLDWVANDPSEDEYTARNYFVLTGLFRGAELRVKASRSDVGEEVKVVQAGPQFVELEDGSIRALKQEAVMWRPTINLSAKSRPGFELDAAPMIKELTA
jgi:hypothetical protein